MVNPIPTEEQNQQVREILEPYGNVRRRYRAFLKPLSFVLLASLVIAIIRRDKWGLYLVLVSWICLWSSFKIDDLITKRFALRLKPEQLTILEDYPPPNVGVRDGYTSPEKAAIRELLRLNNPERYSIRSEAHRREVLQRRRDQRAAERAKYDQSQ